jgi:hypothetical protein
MPQAGAVGDGLGWIFASKALAAAQPLAGSSLGKPGCPGGASHRPGLIFDPADHHRSTLQIEGALRGVPAVTDLMEDILHPKS